MAKNSADALLDKAEERATAETDPSRFNLVRFITNKGVVMPEDKLEIYLDVATSRQIWMLTAERAEVIDIANKDRDARVQRLIKQASEEDDRNGRTIADDSTEILEEIDRLSHEEPPSPMRAVEIDGLLPDLHKKLYESRVIFHLRGVAPALMKAVEKKIIAVVKSSDAEVQEERREAYRAIEMARLATQRIEVPEQEGMDAVGTLSHADMEDVLDNLPPTELNKLINQVQFLTYAGILVDPKVDAGFPGGRDESPGEPLDTGDDQGGAALDD